MHNKYNTKLICNTILQILFRSFFVQYYCSFFLNFNACAVFELSNQALKIKKKPKIKREDKHVRGRNTVVVEKANVKPGLPPAGRVHLII